MSEPMTAAHVAVALVAACGITGTPPDAVFKDQNGRPRVMAAAACVARLGWDRKATARTFQVHPNRLTPSGLKVANVEADHLLTVAEALTAAGLTAGDDPAARHRSDWKVSGRPQSPAAGAKPPKRKAARAEGGAGREPAVAADGAPKPGGGEKPKAVPPPRASRPASTCSSAARPVDRTPKGVRVLMLKPVTADIVRWTRQQMALGADLRFVADCFDVDERELADAVQPMGVAA